jgi:hypothetical protein
VYGISVHSLQTQIRSLFRRIFLVLKSCGRNSQRKGRELEVSHCTLNACNIEHFSNIQCLADLSDICVSCDVSVYCTMRHSADDVDTDENSETFCDFYSS